MESTPIYRLPHDALHQIFSCLPLRQIIICRSVCKLFQQILTSSSSFSSSLRLLSLRPHHRQASPHPALHSLDPDLNVWLRFNLDFLLPYTHPQPVASSPGLLFLWAEAQGSKALLVCNPLTRQFRPLPQLGSAWSRHGSVLVDSTRVLVLTELAALYCSASTSSPNTWLKFSSNLPSKPRSPILVSDSVYSLCDVGSPWRSQWKLFSCTLTMLTTSQTWTRLDKHEWGDVFDILKRPRLVRGVGDSILMVGGLRSSFSLNSTCSTILILRLDLNTLDWEEAGRMPFHMFTSFQDSTKFKVFGGGDRVCFSGKRLGRLALWDCCQGKGDWRWIDGLPGNGDALFRGFFYEATLTALP